MPDAEFTTENVFENVPSTQVKSLDDVDLNSLVSNTHVKSDVKDGVEFTLHPGDKVPKSLIDSILKDAERGYEEGKEMLLELINRRAFVHKDEYVPDPETNKGSVESYNQPIMRNQGSPSGDPSPENEPTASPAKPAEDKSTTPDKVAEKDVAAKVAQDANAPGKDTPKK